MKTGDDSYYIFIDRTTDQMFGMIKTKHCKLLVK